MNMELRVHNAELSSNEDGSMTVSGYVNKTEQLSNVLGITKRFVEKIAKGAFTRAIQNAKKDIDFLSEHKPEKILASTRNGSLTLREDEQGLFMEATIAPTSWGKDAYTLIDSKIYQNMSFGFRTIKDSWRNLEAGLYERTIEELELFEVSVVKDPAYSQSTIAARGIDLVEDVEIPVELQEEERALDEIKELLKTLEERVGSLTDEVKELRSAQEKALEVREEQTPEPDETEEKPDEQGESKAEDKEETKIPDESETKEETKELSDEKSEDSENKDEKADEETEDEEERSEQTDLDFSEFENRLASFQ